jgi:hypothetical protein
MSRLPLLGAAMIMTAICGCGEGPKLVPVTGVVTLDGKPLTEAGILFAPAEAGLLPASGQTDAQGRFQLTTLNRPGATAGSYRVTVVKQKISMSDNPLVPPTVKWFTPQKYSLPETSGLHVSVDYDHREFTFALSSRQ